MCVCALLHSSFYHGTIIYINSVNSNLVDSVCLSTFLLISNELLP